MSDKYDLKLNAIIKSIISLWLEVDPDPLGQVRFASDHLRLVIHKDVNEILDKLEELEKTNTKLKKLLDKKEYEGVKKAIESKKRFPT